MSALWLFVFCKFEVNLGQSVAKYQCNFHLPSLQSSYNQDSVCFPSAYINQF